VFEDWIDDDGSGHGPVQDRLHPVARGRRPSSTSPAPTRRPELDQLPTSTKRCSRCSSAPSRSTCSTRRSCSTTASTTWSRCAFPEGCILKPKKPAALSCRTHMLGRIFDLMGGLLGQGAPDALNAAGFSDSPHFMYSGYDDGEWFQLFQIGFGGIPGRPVGDGPDGHSLWPAFTNVPNEFLEAYFPLRIAPTRPSRFRRRGPAPRRQRHHAWPTACSSRRRDLIHDDRWLTYPWGVNGGEPGMRSTKRLVRKDGSERTSRPSATASRSARRHPLLQHLGRRRLGRPVRARRGAGRADVARGLVTARARGATAW
jgi:N-methylhydantoinase B